MTQNKGESTFYEKKVLKGGYTIKVKRDRY
jgi:hypothetical protein